MTKTNDEDKRDSREKTEKNKKERVDGGQWERGHWVMDPRVEMAFFTSSTFPAENLNTGETEACFGNCSFPRVSFLACT